MVGENSPLDVLIGQWLRRAVALIVATLLMGLHPGLACTGDCNGDGKVSPDEVLKGIRAALGQKSSDSCPAFEEDTDGKVTIYEILVVVNNAFDGCPPAGTACGNGITEQREQCDDGNRIDGDGCTARCFLEPNGNVCIGLPQHAGTQLASRLVTDGVAAPLYVVAPPRDVSRVFIVEQGGRIRIVRYGRLLAQPFLDVSDQISCCGERGLLSLAFHPDYGSNGQFFIDYTDRSGNSVVSRWRTSIDPNRADPASEQIVLRQTQPFANHNGGLLAFGPDGYLYVGFGDGGSRGDPQNNAQNAATWLGKVLRIDVDGVATYRVPPDNPFVDAPAFLPEIWVLGLRNPWRFSFDRLTGDLYIGDVGQGNYEEVDIAPAGGGANFGWRITEGLHCYEPPSSCPTDGLTPPILEYSHADGCSITGGYVYRGCSLPELRGAYFYADYCSDFVRSVRYRDGEVTDPRDWTAALALPAGGMGPEIVSFGEDARGEIYICDLRGAVYQVVPAP